MYGLEGWIVQTDNQQDWDTISQVWDTSVPKDDDSVVMDESYVEDTDSVFESGAVSTQQLWDQELLGPERIWQKQGMLSMAKNPVGFKAGVPDTFFPTDYMKINVSKKYHASTDSGVLFGIASPDYGFAAADNNIVSGITCTKGFYVLAHLEELMSTAMLGFMGILEAGAESPYEDIVNFITVNLEKINTISGVGALTPVTWTAALKLTMGLRTVGSIRQTTIGPDAQA